MMCSAQKIALIKSRPIPTHSKAEEGTAPLINSTIIPTFSEVSPEELVVEPRMHSINSPDKARAAPSQMLMLLFFFKNKKIRIKNKKRFDYIEPLFYLY